MSRILWTLFFVASSVAVLPDASAAKNRDASSFTVRFGNEIVTRPLMAVFVMPETPVLVSVSGGSSGIHYDLQTSGGTLSSVSDRRWRFFAPEQPGLYPLVVTASSTGASIRLQVFVLTPWDHQGTRLDGYRMGRYHADSRRGLARYERPDGFIEVTESNKDVRVSPHFRLKQFLCKQTDDTPQFALVRTRLLQTLERVLATVNEEEFQVETLHVMSGFRTPYYNASIGNTTEYSRHLYGDAADIFVDADGDGWMDDLTNDDRVTKADARRLATIVRKASPGSNETFTGGLGIYGPASHRGPFVHLDLRGYRARW